MSNLKGAVSARRAGVFGLSLALLAGSAFAADIMVPGDVPTIQGAIDIAQPGDVIVVAPGVYQESIHFGNKSITVRSEGGAGVTTIDAGGVPAFAVRLHGVMGDDAVLSGFTITGGLGAMNGEATGGGIRATHSRVVIEDVIVVGNQSILGAGLLAEGGTVVVRNSVFTDNSGVFGGAVRSSGSHLTIEQSVIEGNSAATNGGGLDAQGGTLTLVDVEFVNNGCGQLGGAIFLNHVHVNASQLLVRENGYVEIQNGGTSYVFDTLAGGGVYASNVTGRIDRSRFLGNRGAFGGAFYIAGGGTLEIVNTVMANSVASLGGGVYCNSSSPRIFNCTIVNNPWGVFTTYNSFPSLRNTILSGNTSTGSNEIGGNGLVDVSSSIVNGPVFNATIGLGVVQMHPLLDENFAPLPGSPAIDAGDNTAVPATITLDLLGNARFFDDPDTPDTGIGESPIVDIGAIEFGSSTQSSQCPVDMIHDGVLDFFDVVAFLNMWQNGDPRADMNGDEQHNFFDVQIFLTMFAAGCP